MKKISLALFAVATLFVSCSNDDTTPIDTGGNGQGQNDDNGGSDDQDNASIVGEWTATAITISGEHTVNYQNVDVTGEFEGAATEATVGNVTYEFKEKPQLVVTGGKFDADVTVKIPLIGSIEQELKDQIFGSAGAWVLSDDGKQVIITDAATNKDVVMDIIELTASKLKLKGQITQKLNVNPVGEIEPTLDIEAEFTR